jgi:hypothetical protein
MAEVLEDRTLPSATTVLTSLQDASLRSLAQTDYTKDGSLSRNDMIGIFREVAQDGQVTTKELSDLQNLVSHGMTDLGMALYVKDLSNDVVNYNLANKHFQGQTLLSTGQLAAGPYAAQLNTLVDKWFLGKDLPLANTDASTPIYAYDTTTAGSLFGLNGPSNMDVRQGYLGDCYLISALATAAVESPQSIKDMFLDNGDGTFTVRFFHQINGTQVEDFVTLNRQLPVYSNGTFVFANENSGLTYTNSNNILWVALAEKAYAQLSEEGWSRSGFAGGVNSYKNIAGGLGYQPLQQIMGETTKEYSVSSTTISMLIADVQAGDLITIGSRSSPGDNVIGGHEYYITGYDPVTMTFTVVNPWGANLKTIGTLHLTASQLLADFYEFDVAAPLPTHVAWH